MTPGGEWVLVVDKTGTTGRVENTQVGVFATLVSNRGHTFINRALYLPRC